LLLERFERPIVLTSGNLSEEPQCIDNNKARRKLAGIADSILSHNRAIVNRVDDSVARVLDGKARLLRRARGYAPAPLPLPKGFEAAPAVLAFGGELKNTFCLVKDGQVIVSQHMGDLENAATFADYRKNLNLYRELYEHRPEVLAVDRHPEYLSSKLGREQAANDDLRLDEVQHHHAHIASCMAENGVALEAPPVLGLALDGLGYGEDGTIWGGELLLADYRRYQRLGCLKPVPMIGGTRAIHEPWRSAYAHLRAALGWNHVADRYGALAIVRLLSHRPLATLDRMIEQDINSPLASSCGRLFDAVAAVVGLHPERVSYEGQAAIELEAQADERVLERDAGYSFDLSAADEMVMLDPAPMWLALLHDLADGAPVPFIAARFHRGLADALIQLATRLAVVHGIGAVALSGGCFQNRILFERVAAGLREANLVVLSHSALPANDGGLSLGQAAVAAARILCGKSLFSADS
jgi:hydrogenase maturation protein HypF